LNKCPLNNFENCQSECALYLSNQKCCSIKKLALSSRYFVELKDISRNISSIDSTFTRRKC